MTTHERDWQTMKPGSRLGIFEIVSQLGAGGMGEVFLARDTRLDRLVAIKALPMHLGNDPDRLARFEREAKIVASLNHAGIAVVYAFEQDAGQKLLVMEYVEGETLAARLKRGRLPVDEAFAIAKQIAEALEVAHEKGVIHRDLKPGNVMVTPDGVVKVLDFGLARTAEGSPSTTNSPVAHPVLPTLTSPTPIHSPTMPGVIMGTAGYMSPEQARGKPVDKRSDIFSFGCVLFEMLTGAPPFAGETVTDSLGAILHREPEWSKLPAGTSPAVARLLRRCLAKDRRERLRDIGDARLELANTSLEGDPSDRVPVHSGGPARWIAVGLAAGLVVASAGFALLRGFRATPPAAPAAAARLIHLSIPMPAIGDEPGLATPIMNITPDGESVVFVATDGTSFAAFKRPLDGSESTPFFGSESLILSPDGRWLAFQDGNILFKVPLAGGAPTPVCEVQSEVRGGCWLDDGTLVLARSVEGPLWRVSESGGGPTPLTTLDSTAGELSHRWPEALPGARGVLYVVKTNRMDSFDESDIWAHDLQSGTRKRLVTGGTMPRYVPESPQSGLLIFNREDHLWTVRLDLPSLSLIGIPVKVWSDVPMQPERGLAGFAIAHQSGTLLYLKADRSLDQGELVWVDSATGTATPFGAAPGLYADASIGPSGQVALTIMAANDYISLVDDRGVSRRLSRGSNLNSPVWSASGDALFCRDGKGRVMRIPIADPERIAPVPGLDQYERVTSCSPDGRLMLCERQTSTSGWDIWLFHADGSSPPEPLLVTPDHEGDGVFSPDGKLIAYTQAQGEKPQVFVRSFPSTGPDQQVSLAGGDEPSWSADGRELYFFQDNKVMAAAIPADGSRPGPPRMLFSGPFLRRSFNYARGVQDGRFLMIRPLKKPPTHLDVVLNWIADVKRKLDAAKP